MKYLFLDCETTGTDENQNGIHQLSGCIVINNVVLETFDFRIRPFEGCVIEEQALEINNLKPEDLYTEEYLEEGIVYKMFVNILDKYCNKYDKKDKFFLVGYNVHFDKNFLYKFFTRNNDNYLFSYIWGNHIDVMVLATNALKDRRTMMVDFKQGNVAKFLGFDIKEDNLHDSMYDIFVCIGLYCYLTSEKFNIKENINQTTNYDAFYSQFINPQNLPSKEEQEEIYLRDELNKTITFGKHKGKTVAEVFEDNCGYLIWVYENCSNQTLVSKKLYEICKEKIVEEQQTSTRTYVSTNDKVIDHVLDGGIDDLPF